MVSNSLNRRDNLEKASEMMKILGHPVRLSILCNLLHNGEMSVGNIVEKEEGVGQSQISQYLGILKRMGYVKSRRKGQTIYYDFASDDVKKIIEVLYSIYCQDDS